jgi:succinate dehydrogenase/fumarate reductase cytochrome b subunit
MSSPLDVNLSLLKNKDYDQLQILNPDILNTLSQISNQLSGGTVAVLEMVLYLILAVPFLYGIVYNETAYDQLSEITSCANNISNNTAFYKYLSYAGVVIIAIRVIFAKTFVNVSTTTSCIIELVTGLILWTLFLIQMILSISRRNTLNNTSKCNTSNADQATILDLAKKSANSEVQMAVIGFILTTTYTVVNGIRYYLSGSYISMEQNKQADLIKNGVFPDNALSAPAATISGLYKANPSLSVQEELNIAGIAA